MMSALDTGGVPETTAAWLEKLGRSPENWSQINQLILASGGDGVRPLRVRRDPERSDKGHAHQCIGVNSSSDKVRCNPATDHI